MSKMNDIIAKLAEPIIESQGLELVDVEYLKEGSDWILRVFLDNPDGEVNLEHCENVSRLLSDKLDSEDPIKQSYILEVSSSGIKRPLKKLEDFERFKGKLVEVKTFAPIEEEKEVSGMLLGREGDEIIIQKHEDEGVIKIPIAKIASAHLAIDF